MKCDENIYEDDEIAYVEACVNSTIEMMIFKVPSSSKSWLNYWPEETMCCTAEMEEEEYCNGAELGRLITPFSGILKSSIEITYGNVISLRDIPFVHTSIGETGMYIILFGICSPFTSPILLTGSIESIDPYGYLPADLYGNLPFYVMLSEIYTIAGLCWLVLCYKYMDELINVQYWITLVLALGMLESLFLYDHFLCWNESGTADSAKGIEVIGILFGVFKRAISRVFILMVSMGYGTVKPSLGEDTKRILTLGCVYAIFSFIYDS